MKKLVCELCGGSDFIKDKGVFVCLSCGLKYSLEEAKRMMTECSPAEPGSPVAPGVSAAPAAPVAPAAPAAPVAPAAPAAPEMPAAPAVPVQPAAPDYSSVIDSYMIMAQKAIDAENYPEAEYYSKKILELDSKSSRAWFIKGKAAGWQTTSRYNRYPESIVCWINAWLFAAEAEKPALRTDIAASAGSISSAIVQMELNRFRELRNQNNKSDVDKALAMVREQLKLLKDKTGVEVFDAAFKTTLARQLNSCAVNASNKADADFGPEDSNRDKYNWDNFTAAQDWCLDLLEKAYDFSSDEALCLQICKNYIEIATEVRDSCSYQFQQNASGGGSYVREYAFTAAAKNSRTAIIEKWAEKQQLHDPASRTKNCAKTLESFNAMREKGPRQEAITRFWEVHPQERAALEQERASLDEEQRRVEAAMDVSPDETLAQIDRIVLALTGWMNGPDGGNEKERAALQEQIDGLNAEKTGCRERWAEADRANEARLTAILARKAEIDAAFTRGRGSAAKTAPDKTLTLFSNGTCAATPRQIAEYISTVIPADISAFGENGCILENYSRNVMAMANMLLSNGEADGGMDAPDALKIYHLNFKQNGQDMNAYASIFGLTLDAPFSGYLSFELSKEMKKPETVAAFIRIVAAALPGLCPSADVPALAAAIVSAAYGMIPRTLLEYDGVTVEVQGSSKSDTCVSLKLD